MLGKGAGAIFVNVNECMDACLSSVQEEDPLLAIEEDFLIVQEQDFLLV